MKIHHEAAPRIRAYLLAEGVAEFGRLDIVCANAGIGGIGVAWELTEHQWQEMIDINLTGVWKAVKACIPTMIDLSNGGRSS
jgi:NAD(P)-dependent dehydrogenase (short-subunit alcohol dehydrogenase family)